MSKLIKIQERVDLVKCKDFPLASFSYEYFNPVQSSLIDIYDKDANCVVASNTSSGKTCIAEIFMTHEVRVNKKKAIYLSPLKSLSQEKINDWLSDKHHFSDLKVAICTGDYRSKEDKKKLESADIIIMTFEMLSSMSRNFKSDKNQFLRETGLLAIDEFHNISEENRGSHLEAGIMKFTDINPDSRLLLLSATMPNVEEIGKWVCHITNKDTYYLSSNYRPCKLNIHYEKYEESKWGYDDNEREKINQALKIVKKYPNDKFICFTHTKRTGEAMWKTLKNANIICEYHNSDLPKEKRISIEDRFRNDPNLRVLVATSGMSQGINAPARRVVILGVHRGLKTVKNHEIQQECGRGGRPKYDPEGDAYILLPYKNFAKWMEWVKTPEPIQSQICDPKILAFHLIGEIHHGDIRTMEDVYAWYSRTLALIQKKKLDDDIIEKVMNSLIKSGCLIEEDGQYKVTSTGIVASMFYYSPQDVSDLYRNFSKVFERDKQDYDTWVAMALGNTDSLRTGIVTSIERTEVDAFRLEVEDIEKPLTGKSGFTDGAIKAGYCYYMMMNGKSSPAMTGIMRGLYSDSGRVLEVLSTLNTMGGKWEKAEWIKRLNLRITHGVGEELLDLVVLKGIGRVKAKRLWAAGLKTLKEVSENSTKVITALNCSKEKAHEICQEAKDLS
jgi:helicase